MPQLTQRNFVIAFCPTGGKPCYKASWNCFSTNPCVTATPNLPPNLRDIYNHCVDKEHTKRSVAWHPPNSTIRLETGLLLVIYSTIQIERETLQRNVIWYFPGPPPLPPPITNSHSCVVKFSQYNGKSDSLCQKNIIIVVCYTFLLFIVACFSQLFNC